jgi:hypothetical protein
MSLGFRYLVFFCAAISLHAQGNVLPLLECLDLLTPSGSTTLAAGVAAGQSEIVVSQPIPEAAQIVINPGAPNEETTFTSRPSSTAPFSYRLYGGWSDASARTLAQAHASGEPVVFRIRTGSGYFSYFNLLANSVSIATGSADNFLFPGNPNLGQPSSFAPGVHRFNFPTPHNPRRDLGWFLNGLYVVARDLPELQCSYTPPSVRAEPLYLSPGTTRTNVRLGTVSATYPTTFTATVPYVSRQNATPSAPVQLTTDVAFSNLRVDNGSVFGDVTAVADAIGRYYTYALRTVTATGQAGIASNIIDVAATCPLTVTPSSLPNAFVNTPYSTALQATGATAPYRFALEASALPLGLTLSETGVLSGTPQQTGTFPLNLVITSVTGCFHRTTMNLEILGQFCAANITPQVQVTLGGFRQNLVTRRWQQTVTLRNNTQSSIFGPVAFVLDNLSANATVLNPAGTTTCAEPAGRPFFLAPIGNTNFFAAGSSVSLNLEFTTTAAGAITYTPRVIAGGALR